MISTEQERAELTELLDEQTSLCEAVVKSGHSVDWIIDRLHLFNLDDIGQLVMRQGILPLLKAAELAKLPKITQTFHLKAAIRYPLAQFQEVVRDWISTISIPMLTEQEHFNDLKKVAKEIETLRVELKSLKDANKWLKHAARPPSRDMDDW